MKQGWEYKKIGSLCDITTGKLDANAANENGVYPFFTCSKTPLSINTYAYDCECVLIAGNGDLNVKYYNGKFNAYQRTYILQLKKETFGVDMRYIYAFFNLYIEELRRKSIGGIIKYIKLGDLTNALLPLPNISTQLAIVSELDKINELICLKKEQLKDLDKLAQSIFYEMFGDPVENEMGWEVSTYSKCFNIGSGGTPSKSVPEYWDNGNIPWIGSNMCQNCIITETDGKFITQEGLNNSSTKYLEVGTVLVALVGATIGKVALLRTPTCTNQNVAFIKANESKDFVPEYVFYNLMGQYEEFMKIGKGNFKMANQAFIKALPILSPPLPLQHLFAYRIEQIEHQKAEVQKSIADLETLLASRMQYWFE